MSNHRPIGFRPPDTPPTQTDSNFNYGFAAGVMRVLSGFMRATWTDPDERGRIASQIEQGLLNGLEDYQEELGEHWVRGYRASIGFILRSLREDD